MIDGCAQAKLCFIMFGFADFSYFYLEKHAESFFGVALDVR